MKKLAIKLFTKHYYFLRFDNMIDRHHLLECILWPNGDGTYRKIINRAERLEELGIYDDYKLTIPIEHRVHISMHREFEKGTEYERDISGDKNPCFGRAGDKHPMYGKGYLFIGDKNPMYGRTEDKAPGWKGDNVGPLGAYNRAKKLYKAGKISEKEFQPFRAFRSKYIRQRRIAKNTSSDS